MTIEFHEDPIPKAISLLSRKWNYEIISLLIERGDCRYSDFEKENPEISSKMLSQRLKELYEEGILSKIISKISPLEFKYRLSEKGKLLRKMFIDLGMFGTQIYDEVLVKKAGFNDLKNYFSDYYKDRSNT